MPLHEDHKINRFNANNITTHVPRGHAKREVREDTNSSRGNASHGSSGNNEILADNINTRGVLMVAAAVSNHVSRSSSRSRSTTSSGTNRRSALGRVQGIIVADTSSASIRDDERVDRDDVGHGDKSRKAGTELGREGCASAGARVRRALEHEPFSDEGLGDRSVDSRDDTGHRYCLLYESGSLIVDC